MDTETTQAIADETAVPTKNPILRIELNRVEGELASWRASTFAGANRVLSEWALTAPQAGGYDKVEVTLTWSHGFQHKYRLDLQHPSLGFLPDVGKDLEHFIALSLGEAPHPDWTQSHYERILKRYADQGLMRQARLLREQCMLSDF